MSSSGLRPLTERQSAVMERIDRRVPIKVIAQDLGVSETRINQHIRALKDIYEAASLGELVECHRAANGLDTPNHDNDGADASAKPIETKLDAAPVDPQSRAPIEALSEAAYKKNQVPEGDLPGDEGGGIDPGELVMSDVLPLVEQAPWLRPEEPRVVPRVLDGEHAVWFRLAAIVAIAFGFLAAIVLTVTAAVTISDALDGRATLRSEEHSQS